MVLLMKMKSQALITIKVKKNFENIFDEFETIRTKARSGDFIKPVSNTWTGVQMKKLRAFVILYKMSEVDGRFT